jgi:hypothetical protein
MTDRANDGREFGWSRTDHDRRQAALGLELTPAQRLEWLERTVEEMRRLVGRVGKLDSGANRGSGGSR